jgi:hypothetical protein
MLFSLNIVLQLYRCYLAFLVASSLDFKNSASKLEHTQYDNPPPPTQTVKIAHVCGHYSKQKTYIKGNKTILM